MKRSHIKLQFHKPVSKDDHCEDTERTKITGWRGKGCDPNHDANSNIYFEGYIMMSVCIKEFGIGCRCRMHLPFEV